MKCVFLQLIQNDMNKLVESGDSFDSFMWAIEHGCVPNKDTWRMGAKGGNVEIVKYMYEHWPSLVHMKVLCIVAAERNHLHLLQWAKSVKYDMDAIEILEAAAKFNRMNMCQWLHKNGTNEDFKKLLASVYF